ncbi:PREDICTED: uncharacterized protein LOC106809307 [Priapulus caudatus]|uniref:Mitochondria-eating protein n=1 Tax=Priapulus caudatus TaxID=37621 RepID=A0ABM1E6L2_PRICU|nr:PREDICTED: uncharacterized protein LOC106809307 [Priapulus caudatus]
MEGDARFRPVDRGRRHRRAGAPATKLSWCASPFPADAAWYYMDDGPPPAYNYGDGNRATAHGYASGDRHVHGDGRMHATADGSPAIVLRKLLLLLDYQQFDDTARILHTMPELTLKAVVTDLPVDMLVRGIPRTLPTLDALYTRVFFSAGVQRFPFNLLKPEAIVMQLIRLFAHYEEASVMAIGWSHADVSACKSILQVIVQVDPKLKRILFKRKRALDRALEGLGIHGMVLTADHTKLMNLHDALKLEFQGAIKNYKQVLGKLDDYNLTHATPRPKCISNGPPPTKSSHQRLMSLTQGEIHERLRKNREVWGSVEPVLHSNRLPTLLSHLNERIEADKEALLQFSQLRKDAGGSSGGGSSVIAPILMQYARGFDRVLLMLQEVCDDSVSGYHSDSDSVIMPPSRTTTRSKQSYSQGSTDNLKTIASDSGRGQSVESCTKKDAVHGFTGHPSRSAAGSPVGIPSATCSTTQTLSTQFKSELTSLKQQIDFLRTELSKSKDVIMQLQNKEELLVTRLTDQARKRVLDESKGDTKIEVPSHLIRRYSSLYLQNRVSALHALDALPEMDESDDLKTKLVFSVIVLSFRSVRGTIEKKKAALRQILGLPANSPKPSHDTAMTEMLESIGFYMRKTVDKYDVRPNVQEVCSQLYATLYDFPSLPTCESLTSYIEECVGIAWALSNQIPAFSIEYESSVFTPELHERHHTSDQYSDRILTYLWPSLIENERGPCVYKGVVVT